MKRITVIGGTGYAGRAIVAEAVERGHAVTAVSRTAPADPVAGATYVQGSALDAAFVEGLAGSTDVLVSATAARGDMADRAGTAAHVLADAATKAGVRLVVVGGFSSLRPAAGAPRFIETGVAEEYRVEAEAGHAFLELLQGSPEELDFVFFSPAAKFGSWVPGERTGKYQLSNDVAILDEEGKSFLGAEDLAVAMIDIIEEGSHRRGHVSVVS